MSGNMGIGGVPPAGQNPDDFAIQYAKANGIEYSSMEELRNIMRNKFGDPQAPQGAASMPPVFTTGYNGPVDLSSVSIMNGMMPMQPANANANAYATAGYGTGYGNAANADDASELSGSTFPLG